METAPAGLCEDRKLSSEEIELLADLIIEEPDHYTVLGVERGSSASEINTAYCRAVDFFHPLNYNYLAETDNVLHWKLSCAYLRFVEAFSTLSSRARRRAYDGTLNRQIVGSVRSRQRVLSAADTTTVASTLGVVPGQIAKPHLPLNGRERRRVERVELQLPLVVVFDHHWQEVTETIDVSPLGVKFSLSRAVELGTLLRLELPMPSALRTRTGDDLLYKVSGYVIKIAPVPSGARQVVAEFV
ncbi:MAG: PilZ domain-containing protein [Blastocatellia bacterium]